VTIKSIIFWVETPFTLMHKQMKYKDNSSNSIISSDQETMVIVEYRNSES
jgi:hypothetical protein